MEVNNYDESLINCVKQFPYIYDNKHHLFKSKTAKQEAWKSISTILGLSYAECENRWNVMRNKLTTAIRKERKASIPGQLKNTKLYKSMHFLEKFIVPRRRTSAILKTVDGDTSRMSIDVENSNFSLESNSSNSEILLTPKLEGLSPGYIDPDPSGQMILESMLKTEEHSETEENNGPESSLSNNSTYLYFQKYLKEKQREFKQNANLHEYDTELTFGMTVGYLLQDIPLDRRRRVMLRIMNLLLRDNDSE